MNEKDKRSAETIIDYCNRIDDYLNTPNVYFYQVLQMKQYLFKIYFVVIKKGVKFI